jgi:hypothetical protein
MAGAAVLAAKVAAEPEPASIRPPELQDTECSAGGTLTPNTESLAAYLIAVVVGFPWAPGGGGRDVAGQVAEEAWLIRVPPQPKPVAVTRGSSAAELVPCKHVLDE